MDKAENFESSFSSYQLVAGNFWDSPISLIYVLGRLARRSLADVTKLKSHEMMKFFIIHLIYDS